MYTNLITELNNYILTIVINRPKYLNALNKQTVLELEDCILNAQENNLIKGIIITGSGEKAFVSGADIKEFIGLSEMEARHLAEIGQSAFKTIENCKKPVLAAVNGLALGGGCELAMACHLRIASEHAEFGQPEVKLGIIAGYGGTQRLIQYIGKTKATEYHLTGKNISSENALNFGLINYIVPKDQLMQKSIDLLNDIIKHSPITISAVLRSLNSFYDINEKGFESEINEFGKCFLTNDSKEGIAAFLEKRKPNFKGN